MSAYIVEQNVVGFLIMVGIEYGIIDPHNAVAEARMLWLENQRSIHYRYDDSDDYGNVPDITKKEQLGEYEEFNPDQVIMSCGCYSYQSCEHPEWESSEAKCLVDKIKEEAIARGGCEKSCFKNRHLKWGAPEPKDIEEVKIPRGRPVIATLAIALVGLASALAATMLYL